MAKATRVFSTPPTNSSRRRFLTQSAMATAAVATATSLVPGLSPGIEGEQDPAFALIAEKRAADIAHCKAIDRQDEAEDQDGIGSDAAWEAADRSVEMCGLVNAVDWKLATTVPTTLAGVTAVLRLANALEDEGGEWPSTDTIGPDGWHYQLRATMARAIEAIISKSGGAA